MSTYDLEEQEQIAALKAWWTENANRVLSGITIVLLAVSGWYAWNGYRGSQSQQAAALYENLQKAARANDMKAVSDSAGTLLEKYAGTAYGPLAALVAAKAHYQAGDLKTARAQLEWVIGSGASEEIKSIARMRLANVLLDQNAPEEALKAISAKPAPGFESLFESLRGDIQIVLKKLPEAAAAYRGAMEKADPKNAALREQLKLKLDALGSD